MWIVAWHAVVWTFLFLPKILFWVGQRLAVWTGTVFLFRQGKHHKIYYFLSIFLYSASWGVIVYLCWRTPSHLGPFRKILLAVRSQS